MKSKLIGNPFGAHIDNAGIISDVAAFIPVLYHNMNFIPDNRQHTLIFKEPGIESIFEIIMKTMTMSMKRI